MDRRIGTIEQVAPESESEDDNLESHGENYQDDYVGLRSQGGNSSSITSTKMNEKLARQYVGELIQRVDIHGGNQSPRFQYERPSGDSNMI